MVLMTIILKNNSQVLKFTKLMTMEIY